LVESIYETLLEAIVSGRLALGSELNSVGLAKQLDVSRTPLREALRLLERDGLVHLTENHKARVANFSTDDIREIYEVRLLVRSFCVLTGQPSTLKQALNEHIAIIHALATGRPSAARKAMSLHISSRWKDVLSRLSSTSQIA
jgi:DNA-binding GntR family transcriptional regulator